MIRSISLALMEAENMRRRMASQADHAAQHPLAEFYGDWERARAATTPKPEATSFTISLSGDDA